MTATICNFPALPATVKTFKSRRSAVMAANKADKAYEVAMVNRGVDELRSTHGQARVDLGARVDSYLSAAWDNLEATVKSADAQGYYVTTGWTRYFAGRSGVDLLIE